MEKRFRRALVLGWIASLLLTTLAFAQIPSATLIGRVTDESGVGLPGVLVSANSDAVQGTKTTHTGANGDYKIPFLPPGIYTVRYQLDGFTEVERELKLSAAQTSTSSIELRPSEVIEETIVVTSDFDTISRTSTGAATFTQDEVEKLAIERDLDDAALLSPGVTATGPGSTEENPVLSIAGAMSFENLFMVNGVVVNENVRGQELPLFIEDAVEETTTSISAVSAEYGRFTGGVVNAITKSGGNRLEGSIRVNLDNDDWISQNSLSPERIDNVNDTLEGTLGGAFLRDHIWFFGAGRDRSTEESETTEAITFIPYTATDDEQRIEGKLTFAATQRHNLVGSYIDIDRSRTNTGFGTFLDLDSLNPNRTDPQEIVAVNYNGVLSSNFFLESQYSERDFIIGKGSGGPQDLIEGTLMRRRGTNHRYHAPTFCGSCEDEIRNNENFLLKGSYFLTSKEAGTHDLVFGYDTFNDIRFAVNHQTGSDFTVYSSDIVIDANTQEIFPVIADNTWIRWFAIINLDAARPTDFTTNSFYVNDSWQLNDKWSFNLGARYDENDGTNAVGALVADDSKVSPRVSLTYDVKSDGNLQINASYATYVAGIANTRANATSDGGAVSSFVWDYGGAPINTDTATCNPSNTSGCISTSVALQMIFDWYQSVGGRLDDPFLIDPSSELETDWFVARAIPGATAQILGSVKSPSTDEFSLGFVKRLGNKGTFRADLVYRDFTDFYSNRTTLETGTVQLPNGTFTDLTDVGNFGNSVLSREYSGLHTQFRYNLTDRLRVAANYSLSKTEGNINGETTNSGPVPSSPLNYPEYFDNSWSSPVGDLLTDQRHKLRAWAVYDVLNNEHNSLSVSLLQNFFSGTPYSAVGSVDTRPVVDNPGYLDPPTSVGYFFSDRGAFKTDDMTRTDIALNYSFRWNAFGRSMQVFIQPEVLNLFDESAVIAVDSTVFDATSRSSLQTFNPFTETPIEGVHWEKGPDFGQPTDEEDIQRPRLFRLSVGFRF